MSFNSLLYDKDTSIQNLKLSHEILKYKFNKPEQCSECYNDDPHNRIQRSGASVDKNNSMIDIDSELSGITRIASKDINKKYKPSRDNKPFDNKLHYNDCNNPVVEHTRLSNPPSTLRGTGVNRWENVFINPQQLKHIELPFCNNVDTSILEKDNHRPLLHKTYTQPHQPSNCNVSLYQ